MFILIDGCVLRNIFAIILIMVNDDLAEVLPLLVGGITSCSASDSVCCNTFLHSMVSLSVVGHSSVLFVHPAQTWRRGHLGADPQQKHAVASYIRKNDLLFTGWQHQSAIPPFIKLPWSLLLLLCIL